MLPNFLVIGPGKTGTTWMYHALGNHPRICVSSAKETLFFENEFERGIEWYEGFFEHCDKAYKAIGEVSNTYIFCSSAPARIKSVNPKMKLICCLRNPIERTFSHYLFLIRGGQFSGTFREVLETHPHLLDKGKYYKNLKPYLETFEERQLCIKLFDELKEDQVSFIQSIYRFLEVDDRHIPELDSQYRLSAAKPRNRWLALIAKKGARFARYFGRPDLISKIKYSGITRFLYKEYDKNQRPEISEEDRLFLKEHFREDIKKLSAVLNKDLEHIWFG